MSKPLIRWQSFCSNDAEPYISSQHLGDDARRQPPPADPPNVDLCRFRRFGLRDQVGSAAGAISCDRTLHANCGDVRRFPSCVIRFSCCPLGHWGNRTAFLTSRVHLAVIRLPLGLSVWRLIVRSRRSGAGLLVYLAFAVLVGLLVSATGFWGGEILL